MKRMQIRLIIDGFDEKAYDTFDKAWEAFENCGLDGYWEGEYQNSNRLNKREWVASLELWREDEDEEMEYVGTIDSVEYGWREHCIVSEVSYPFNESELRAAMLNLAFCFGTGDWFEQKVPEDNEYIPRYSEIRRETIETCSPEQFRLDALREYEHYVKG